MCGIVGCKLKRPLSDDDIEKLRAIKNSLSHRGPDDTGEFIDPENGFYLGHTRLSILDIDKRSNQPMQKNGLVISYNGEIYNYLELRKELEKNDSFSTSSDTEVLLGAWKKWGDRSLEKLDGMFAFAMRDGDSVHLVTDPFGEKPLYVYKTPNGFYFASEAPALIQAFGLAFSSEIGEEKEFLNLGFLCPPKTGFKGLLVLPPGAHFIIKNDRLVQHHYWKAPLPYIGKGKVSELGEDVIDQIRDLLCASLEKRLRSDVPLGLFLSSGVDSTLVAALAKCELGVDLNSYTVAFPDGKDEAEQAARISRHFSINHTIINSLESNLWQKLPENLANFYGCPIDNTTVFSIYQMSEAVRPYMKVVLSGLGGDELFYGYNKYSMFYRLRHLYNFAEYFAPLLPILAQLPFKKAKLLPEILKKNKEDQFLRIKNGQSQNLLPEIQDFGFPKNLGLVHGARQFDLQTTMPANLIPSVDRGSMRASIEIRTPFLNRDLTNYCFGLDQRALIHFGQKSVLKRLLARYMPLSLLNQAKQGFVFPVQRYFNQFEIVSVLGQNYESADLSPDLQKIALRDLMLKALKAA